MLETWRLFGPLDRITLPEIAQTGARGIVTALHEVPYGEVWTPAAIAARKALISDAGVGLHWAVVESLPVHYRIKRGEGDLSPLFANYRASLENLSRAGIRTICYNFMTVVDWIRTDHALPMRGGARALVFSAAKMAAFERYMLKRDIAGEYPVEAVSAGDAWFDASTEADRADLLSKIMAGLPGSYDRFTIEGLRAELAKFQGLTAVRLREDLGRFLDEVIPTSERIAKCYDCLRSQDMPLRVDLWEANSSQRRGGVKNRKELSYEAHENWARRAGNTMSAGRHGTGAGHLGHCH